MYITDIRQGKKNRNRYNVYDDDGFAFSVYAETVVSFGMSAGAELSDEQKARILDADEKKYAVDTALKFLSLRMRSVREVRDRLVKSDISEGSIDYTVGRLSELGYLDDRQYAAAYASELAEKYGAGMIRQKLTQRGIAILFQYFRCSKLL